MEALNREEIEHLIPQLKMGCIIAAVVFSAALVGKDAFFYEAYIARMTLIYTVPKIFIFFFWIRFKLDESYLFKMKISGLDVLVIILTFIPFYLFYSGSLLFLVYAGLTTKVSLFQMFCALFVLYILNESVLIMDQYLAPTVGIGIALVLVFFRYKALAELKE